MSTTQDLMQAMLRTASNAHTAGVTLDDVREGSVVVIRGGFGAERAETVTLNSVDADIKNGRAGCDYTNNAGEMRWAYLTQIVRVVKY